MDDFFNEQTNGRLNEGSEATRVNPDQVNVIMREIANVFRDATLGAINEVKPEGRENNWVRVRNFYGEEEEDPFEWIEAFERASGANNWSNGRKIKIATGYLAGMAADWYHDNKNELVHWDNEYQVNASFVPAFLKYFATPERKHQWQVELNSLKQKESEHVSN